jgi:hypothetical protein
MPSQGNTMQAMPCKASHTKPSQAKPSQAKPSQAKPSQSNASQGEARQYHARQAKAMPRDAKPSQGNTMQAMPCHAIPCHAKPRPHPLPIPILPTLTCHALPPPMLAPHAHPLCSLAMPYHLLCPFLSLSLSLYTLSPLMLTLPMLAYLLSPPSYARSLSSTTPLCPLSILYHPLCLLYHPTPYSHSLLYASSPLNLLNLSLFTLPPSLSLPPFAPELFPLSKSTMKILPSKKSSFHRLVHHGGIQRPSVPWPASYRSLP